MKWKEIHDALQPVLPGIAPADIPEPSYNIAPTQAVVAVTAEDAPRIEMLKWGFIPSWAADAKISTSLINARAETVAEKPAFRNAFKKRRCLVLADGFFEWKQEGKAKQPYFIHMADDAPFCFAGLWSIWHAAQDDELRTCTLITTEPNELMARIHNRMPAILPAEAYQTWLDPKTSPAEAEALLVPYPAELMEAYPVSAAVNRPANNTAENIKPI